MSLVNDSEGVKTIKMDYYFPLQICMPTTDLQRYMRVPQKRPSSTDGCPKTNVATNHPANTDGELNMEDELSLSKRALPEISHNFNQESVEGREGVNPKMMSAIRGIERWVEKMSSFVGKQN